jgi:hypothetical protein
MRRQLLINGRPRPSFKLRFRIGKTQPRAQGLSHSSSTRQSSTQERTPGRKPAMAKPSESRVHHPSKPSCGVNRMVERPAAGTPQKSPISAAIPSAFAVMRVARASNVPSPLNCALPSCNTGPSSIGARSDSLGGSCGFCSCIDAIVAQFCWHCMRRYANWVLSTAWAYPQPRGLARRNVKGQKQR